jgi:hypothetical protein
MSERGEIVREIGIPYIPSSNRRSASCLIPCVNKASLVIPTCHFTRVIDFDIG